MKYDMKTFDPGKILVSPSLLAADFSKLGEQVAEAEAAGCGGCDPCQEEFGHEPEYGPHYRSPGPRIYCRGRCGCGH